MINGRGKLSVGLGLRPACPECGSHTISEEMFPPDKVFLKVPVAVCATLLFQMRFAEVPAMTYTLPTLS